MTTPQAQPRALRQLLLVLVTAAVAAPAGAWWAGTQSAAPHAFAPRGAAAPAASAAKPRFLCPMHPEVVSDEPGLCPICNMRLVPAPAAGPATPSAAKARFLCPMHPEVVSDEPGLCPSCNMRLVPAPAAGGAHAHGPPPSEVDGLAAVDVDATHQQLLGLRTAVVDRGPVGAALRTSARVAMDETRVRRVNVKVAGYVERVFADSLGKTVRKGQPLFTLFSPELLAAEHELLAAQRAQSPALVAAARRKLELWDVPEAELERLQREATAARAVTFPSPVSGVVTRKDVLEGSRLEVGATPYDVVDLSTVWVLADVYEAELRFISPGLPAQLTLPALPGRVLQGKVAFVDPLLDPRTRTARVRVVFANAAGELRPEMFGEVTLERPVRDVLRAPVDALLRGGTEDVVFVARGEGRFEPRRVTVGEVGREYAEILSGLDAGDAVVTRATFLLDSESKLRASLAKFRPAGAPAEPSADARDPAVGEPAP